MSCCVQDSGVNNCLSWHPTGENIFLDPQDIYYNQSRQEPKANIFKGMKGDRRNFSAHSKQEKIFFFLYFLFPAEPVSNSSRRSTGANSNSRCASPPHGGAATSRSVSLKPRQIWPKIKWKHVILSEKTPAPFFVPLLMWERRPVLI